MNLFMNIAPNVKPVSSSLNAKRLPIAIAVTSALSAGTPLLANAEEFKELPLSQAEAQADESYKIDNASSHKYTQPLIDTAKTITIIPESAMKDRGVDSLRDALRNVSGISMAAGEGGQPTGDSMYIRGFSARTDIFVDGIRDIAGYSRDTYNVEAIEVAKGPGSAVSGRGSTGGSINLATKTAKLDEFSDISLRLGSEKDYRATLDANVTVGDTSALRINLLSDDGEVAGRDDVENSKDAAAFSFATGLGTHTRINLNADYQKQDNLPDYGLPWVFNSATTDPVAELASSEGKAPPVDYSNFYGNLDRDFETIEAKSFTAKVEHDISQSTMLRAQTRLGSVERESIVTAPRFLDLTSSTDVRLSDEKTRDTKDSLAVLQVDLIGHYQTGSIKHDVVTGIEFAKEEFKRWNLTDVVDDNLDSTPMVVDLYNPDSSIAFTGKYERDGTHIEAESETQAIYFFDTLTLNKQWELSGGLRWEEFETLYQHDYEDPSLEIDKTDSLLSWNLAAVYKPSATSSVYLGVGNSHNPSAESLTISTRGNLADLDPEKTRSYELGAKWEMWQGKLLAGAAVFRTEKTNARTDDPVAENTRDDTLDGKQRVDGLELNATGQINDELMIIAAYTFQDSEVLEAKGDDVSQIGKALPRTPKHSLSIWSHYDITDKLAAGFGAQYIGERYNSSTPESREHADSYLIYDMMISYQLSDQFGLQFNGSNLTDKEYEDQLGGGHFIPGEGRYLSLTGTYSL